MRVSPASAPELIHLAEPANDLVPTREIQPHNPL
jgi:hypothetical protein